MTTKYELKEVRIDQIKPSEDNPRKTFNQERLKELAESIKSIDLMEEIVVRPSDNSHYEIINGERRWRAERELIGNEGLLKVRVYDVDRVTAQEMRLTELSQREDVDQIEVENAVYKYWLLKGKPQYSKIAIKIGYSEPWISAAVNAGKDRFPTQQDTPEPIEELFEVVSDELSALRFIKNKAPKAYDELLKARASGIIDREKLREYIKMVKDLGDEVIQEDTLKSIKQKNKAQEQKPKQEKPKPKETKAKKKQEPKKKATLDEIKDKAPKIYDEIKKAKSNGLIDKKKEEKLVKKVQEDPDVTQEDTLKDVTKREKAKEPPKQEKQLPEWKEIAENYKKEQDEHKAWLDTLEGRKRIEVSENAHRHFHIQTALEENTGGVYIFCPKCGKGKEFLGWMCCETPADEAVKLANENRQKNIDENPKKELI